MTKLLDLALGKISSIMLDMATLATDTVTLAIKSYEDDALTNNSKIFDSSTRLRYLQEEVSELTIECIARFQPVATDLRYIKSCIEISYVFSRFGRYSYDITTVLEILGPLKSCDKSPINQISRTVLEMMNLSISALQLRDNSSLDKIYEMEEMVDVLYRKSLRGLIKDKSSLDAYSDNRCNISSALVLKYLERISDHACYIADSVNYIMTGTTSPRR